VTQLYKWLFDLGNKAPRVIQEGLRLLGVQEVVGKGSNKTIIGWRDELNQAAGVNPLAVPISGFYDDDIAWCGLYAAIVVFRARWQVVDEPLWARNWASFGQEADDASLGDVLVFKRPGGGHVGFYVGEDSSCFHVLNGNAGNRVEITRIEKKRCIAVRRPLYRDRPATARPRKLAPSGAVSTNER
jgi:uncharacterized protein (TIGR02594 family)